MCFCDVLQNFQDINERFFSLLGAFILLMMRMIMLYFPPSFTSH